LKKRRKSNFNLKRAENWGKNQTTNARNKKGANPGKNKQKPRGGIYY